MYHSCTYVLGVARCGTSGDSCNQALVVTRQATRTLSFEETRPVMHLCRHWHKHEMANMNVL